MNANLMTAPRVRAGRRTPAPDTIPAAFAEQLSRLYAQAQVSTHVFASPLGPIPGRSTEQFLPRFVYFGPGSSDVSVRLAFLAGFGRDELPTTFALLHFVEELAIRPSLGQQLSLSFFPLVESAGTSSLGIAGENWAQSSRPEIQLLAQDARQRAYDGFIRLESNPADDLLVVRLRTSRFVRYPAPGVELIEDSDVAPYAVRWEYEPAEVVADGPLTMAAEPLRDPFELTLRFPSHWTLAQHREAATTVLTRFVQRYRGFVAYGQNL